MKRQLWLIIIALLLVACVGINDPLVVPSADNAQQPTANTLIQLRDPLDDLCMQAVDTVAGSELQLQACADSSLQYFTYTEDGTIRLQNTDSEAALCLAVAAGEGEPTGGPSHLRRALMLQPCATVEPALSLWAMPGASLP